MQQATHIYRNGTILTMDETRGLYAEALLAEDGRIAAVGARSDVEAAAHAPEIVDLHGAALLPAFIDPHSHLSSYAMGLQQIALEGVKSYEEIIARVQQYLKDNNIPAGQWVTAHGYDHNALAERRPPDRTVLDAAAPQNPLVLQHVSGHTGVFNTLALQGLGQLLLVVAVQLLKDAGEHEGEAHVHLPLVMPGELHRQGTPEQAADVFFTELFVRSHRRLPPLLRPPASAGGS